MSETGIYHTTPAAGRGIKIAKSSYNEAHIKGTCDGVLTDHNKTVHDALDIDADTLDGHDTDYFALSSHTHGGSSSNGKDGAGFVNNMLTLWDKTNGEIPDGFTEVSELSGTNFTVIKYVGGEEMTNLTHSVKIVAAANVTVLILDNQDTTQISAVNQTLYASLTSSIDKAITINIANATGSPITYNITAYNPEDGANIASIPLVVADSANADAIFTLPSQCYITVAST